jgi:hypothetical protein
MGLLKLPKPEPGMDKKRGARAISMHAVVDSHVTMATKTKKATKKKRNLELGRRRSATSTRNGKRLKRAGRMA